MLTIGKGSAGEDTESKKPRRSARISGNNDGEDTESLPATKRSHLPSPMTRKESTSTSTAEDAQMSNKARTVSPSNDRSDQARHTPASSPAQRNGGLTSPPDDTQPYSQFLPPPRIAYEVADEEGEGVWGYLVPVDGVTEPLVLRKRAACPVPATKVGKTDGKQRTSKKEYQKQEDEYEVDKATKGVPAGGYLIGRHPECGGFFRDTEPPRPLLTSHRPPRGCSDRLKSALSVLYREQAR